MKTGKNVQRSTLNAQRSSFFGVLHSATNHQPPTTNHAFPTPNSSFLTPKFSSSRTRAAFTLFELLAVITIIGIVLAMTLGSFTGWGDASAVSGGAKVVEAALNQAHDYAVARRVPVVFHYETDCNSTNGVRQIAAFMLATLNGQPVGVGVQRLPGGTWLTPESTVQTTTQNAEGQYVFLPDSTVTNAFPSFQTFRFFVVSRKMRDALSDTPAIAYSVTIDPSSGTATAERYDH